MKRLLAYLFIVLGLGLVFSVNSWAPIKLNFNDKYLLAPGMKAYFFTGQYQKEQKKDDSFIILSTPTFIKYYDNDLEELIAEDKLGNWKMTNITKENYSKHLKLRISEKTYFKMSEVMNVEGRNNIFKSIIDKGEKDKLTDLIDEYLSHLVWQKKITKNKASKKKLLLTEYFLNKDKQTQIAKAEPSQTQKVAKIKKKSLIGVILCQRFSNKQELVKSENWFVLEGNKKCKDNDQTYANPIAVSYNEYIKYNKYRQFCYNKTTKDFAAPKRGTLYASCDVFGKKLGEENQWSEVVWRYTSNNNINYFSPKQTQIAKTETTVKPKKKVKVVKVEDSTQEEFKPKKTNQDNEAPVIEIAEVITVNDTDYEFQGKVTDQAKTIYVEVDGRPTDVKNGKFIVKGYSPIDKQISIEAIDQWGNRSEPKIVKLKIDIKDTSIAEKLEPLNPSKIRSKSSNDKVALIIGIENYLESPNARYANLDAKYFFDYARKGFGVKKQNINLLVDEDATFVKTNKALTKWLRSKIKSGQSDLIIFFAGHGLASNDGKELYLLPQDSDPDLLSRTALSRTELFQEIIGLNPNSVTMFLDTCYSGVSRDEKMLLASARPIRIVSNEEQDIPDNFTIFSASQLDQISSGIKEAKHGIFSYYLMKGLEGYADANKDKNITNGELLAYMDENVSQKASELGRQQNPSFAGDPDKVLMSYR